MHKVVLDTNILVSSLISTGPPAQIMDLVAYERIVPIYNDLILYEYWDVLSREKFKFSSDQIIRLIDGITKTGILIENPEPSYFKMADEDDRIFFDTAWQASAYLTTGNIKHFPQKHFIVSPVKFLDIYQKKVP